MDYSKQSRGFLILHLKNTERLLEECKQSTLMRVSLENRIKEIKKYIKDIDNE